MLPVVIYDFNVCIGEIIGKTSASKHQLLFWII